MNPRNHYHVLKKRLLAPRKFMQILLGARQVGKTTIAEQIIQTFSEIAHYASADQATLQDSIWLRQAWELARIKAKNRGEAILILDEIQKIASWSSEIKALWDEDTRLKYNLKVILLGSSPWLVEKGLTESLAGRFEILFIPHWSFSEMQENFDWDVERYIYFGGYPGAAQFATQDEQRWVNYIQQSLIETTLSRDILLLTNIHKPALLRRLFHLGAHYSGQILSYQKMLGQLQDAGNTTTLAHYLKLLDGANMIAGLQKFAGQQIRKRASSPKFQVYNTALQGALCELSFDEARQNPNIWGRFVETSVGAHLLNGFNHTTTQLFYWRFNNQEVDFIVKKGETLIAIEVKSGRRREALSGMSHFCKTFTVKRPLLVGTGGISIEEFLSTPVTRWLEEYSH